MKVSAGVVLGALALVVSCAVGGVVLYDRVRVADPVPSVETEKLTGAELEADAKVRLPAGTTLLSAVWRTDNRGLDTFVYARFRFSRGALPQFLADSGLAQPTPGLRAVADKDFTAGTTWHPDAAANVAGIAETQPYQHVYRNVLLDLGNPQDVTVWLVASQT